MSLEEDQMAKLIKQLGIKAEDLDSLVHDIVSAKASSINNGGLESQIKFLMSELDDNFLWEEVVAIARHKGITIKPVKEN